MANYEKMCDLFDLAFWMQESHEGISLNDIQNMINSFNNNIEKMQKVGN